MEPVESFKSFLLFSFIISTLAGSSMVWKGPKDKTKSVSFHAATAKKGTYMLYATAFITATILFYLFCLYWFIPTLQLPTSFTFLLTLMSLLLVLTALIPESGEWIKLHALLAYGFAFLMMILLFFVLTAQTVSLFARIISGITCGWMTIVWYLYFFSSHKKKVASQYLFYQSSYVILFFLSILAATYIR
ncbi:MAG: hypothetical protein AAB553_05780 [Patescibacteria group bacterium]